MVKEDVPEPPTNTGFVSVLLAAFNTPLVTRRVTTKLSEELSSWNSAPAKRSPDAASAEITSDDGSLRIIGEVAETLLPTFTACTTAIEAWRLVAD